MYFTSTSRPSPKVGAVRQASVTGPWKFSAMRLPHCRCQSGLRRSGLALLDKSRFGTFGVPTEWESLAGASPQPAAGFPAAFGYNAIRIPLYLALDGGEDARQALRRFAGTWAQTASTTQLVEAHQAPVTVPLGQPGYTLVMATARCVSAGTAVPPEAISTRSDLYFPETLRLLSVIAIQERYSACL